MTPSEAAISTLANLVKLGKIDIHRQGKLVSVRYQGRWKGEVIQIQAVESTLLEALLVLSRQAAGRKK